jgi:thymidine phosphorylase
VEGTVQKIEAYRTGMAAVTLGAGRNKTTDTVFPYVGIQFHKKSGESVKEGEPILELYGETSEAADRALEILKEAVHIETARAGKNERHNEEEPLGSFILKEIVEL